MLGRCGVDAGSMQGRYEVDVFVDGNIYRINEEVEEEEGNNKIVVEEEEENKKEKNQA